MIDNLNGEIKFVKSSTFCNFGITYVPVVGDYDSIYSISFVYNCLLGEGNLIINNDKTIIFFEGIFVLEQDKQYNGNVELYFFNKYFEESNILKLSMTNNTLNEFEVKSKTDPFFDYVRTFILIFIYGGTIITFVLILQKKNKKK